MRRFSWIQWAGCCIVLGSMLISVAPSSAKDKGDEGQSKSSQQSRDDDDSNQSTSRSQSRDQSQDRDQQSRQASSHEAGLGVILAETQDGVVIQQVFRDSPADDAGLRRGDYIQKIDDDRVRSARDVMQMVRDKQPGSDIDITVWRNGQQRTMEAQLASRQQAFSQGEKGQFSQPGQFGQQGQFGSRPGAPQQGFEQGQHRLYQDNNQALAQQVQNLQRQLARLQQEVDQLRSERQALRPTYDDRGSSRSPDSQRSSDQQRSSNRNGDSNRND